MNCVILSGRLVRDVTEKYGAVRFTLAVNRDYKSKNENAPDADFISCVAFGKTGEFINKYFTKGSKMDLRGRIQTGSFTNRDGQKVYTTDVFVDHVEFGESKASAKASGDNSVPTPAAEAPKPPMDTSFMEIPDDSDDEMPFN